MTVQSMNNQKGIALITAILMLVVLSILGIIAVNITTIGAKITGNTRTSKQAFYMAEAGIEHARELIRSNTTYRILHEGKNTNQAISAELDSVKGADLVLTDSNNNNAANFSTTDDTPFIDTTNMGNGSYKVYLTNDNDPSSGDVVTSPDDKNSIVTLTSFGYGPDNSRAIIQATVQRIPISNLPGAISLPGPNVNFHGGNSNAVSVEGAAYPAVAVNSLHSNNEFNTTNDARNEVIAGIPTNRLDKYKGEGYDGTTTPITPSVINKAFPDPWGNIEKLQTLYQGLKSIADFTSPSDPGYTMGTDADPKLVVIEGDYEVPLNTSGSGILLVTGNLTFLGNFSYNGVVLAIGKGSLVRTGAGTGEITGGVFVANIAGPDGDIKTREDNVWGIPTWDTSGGGESDIDKVVLAENNAFMKLPFVIISWKQIYQ